MAFAGNMFPRRWKNNGRQVSRRAFLLYFRKLVKKACVDTRLSSELELDTDRNMRKCACLYVEMATTRGHMDIEAPGMMPDQVREFMKHFEGAIDPLSAFLDDGGFEFDACMYMPLDDFKRRYYEFRKANGFGQTEWTKDHYETTFMAYDISTCKGTMQYEGRQQTKQWVCGLDLAE